MLICIYDTIGGLTPGSSRPKVSVVVPVLVFGNTASNRNLNKCFGTFLHLENTTLLIKHRIDKT